MIDFRYHLVSIIAVFLALAVGLLLGSTYLSGYNEEFLGKLQTSLSNQNRALHARNTQLNNQVTGDQAFAQASAKQLLAPGGNGLLAGDRVVLVEAPGSTGMASGVIASLEQAGATVTGQVQLQSSFFNATGQTESSLTQLAQQLAPQAGVTLPTGNPAYSAVAGQQDAAAVIAASIVSKDGIGLTAQVNRSILSGFAQAGFLQVTSRTQPGAQTLGPATLAVVLTPEGTPQQDTSEALVAVASELKSVSLGTVMAGSVNAIAANSAIGLVGNSGPVSTVDNADTESGQIMVAQALRELLNGKAPVAYGIETGTAPSPAPTPVSTPSSATIKTKGTH